MELPFTNTAAQHNTGQGCLSVIQEVVKETFMDILKNNIDFFFLATFSKVMLLQEVEAKLLFGEHTHRHIANTIL